MRSSDRLQQLSGGGSTKSQRLRVQMQLRLMLCDHWDNPVAANLKTWRECLQANASRCRLKPIDTVAVHHGTLALDRMRMRMARTAAAV
jgi:hypothetical protein